MAFPARVFRILIASPSDVTEERDIAVRTIQEWNDLNSHGRQVVLLPLRWETHSAPEYGRRPQEVINRQIVDHSDLLVGVFWTRVGSPTGQADSGTLEEIERVASAGKPVMLYFSQSKQDPERIDIEQLGKLREFKKKTFPKALVENYSSQIEFRDKLAKHLEIQIRTLIAAEVQSDGNALPNSATTDIQLAFADPETGKSLGQSQKLKTTNIRVVNIDKLPDYKVEGKLEEKEDDTSGFFFSIDRVNKDYYRDTAEFIIRQNFFQPVRFWLKNVGGIGARDVYVDLRLEFDKGKLVALPPSKARLSSPPSKESSIYWSRYDAGKENELLEVGSQWTTNLELRALQPQREISLPVSFFVGAYESGVLTITARIFADTLPEPTTRVLRIDLKVVKEAYDAAALLKEHKIYE